MAYNVVPLLVTGPKPSPKIHRFLSHLAQSSCLQPLLLAFISQMSPIKALCRRDLYQFWSQWQVITAQYGSGRGVSPERWAWTVTEIHNGKSPDHDSLTGCHLFGPLGHWSFSSHLQNLFSLFLQVNSTLTLSFKKQLETFCVLK